MLTSILVGMVMVASRCRANDDLWISERDKTSIVIDREEYVAYFKTYDRRTLVFMTKDEFLVFTIQDFNQVKQTASIPHNLENVHQEFRAGFVTQHYIGYITAHTFFYFTLSNDMKALAAREIYPVNYFKVHELQPVYSINLWRGLAVIKTSNHDIHYLDFSSPKMPKMVKLKIPWTIGHNNRGEVEQIKSFGYGTEHAIRYNNNTIDIFDIVKQVHVKRFDFKAEIQQMDYDYVTNKFVVLYKEGNLDFIDCRSMEIVGSSYIRLNLSNIARSFRTGTSFMAFQTGAQTVFYDLVGYNISSKIEADLGDGDQFFSYIELTNIIITIKSIAETYVFTFNHLKSNLSFFCHQSCQGKCSEPFKPCSKIKNAYMSFMIAFACLTGLGFCVFPLFTLLERRAAKNQTLSEDQKESLKYSMLMRNPMGSSIMIQEKRSNIKTIRKQSSSSIAT